MSTNREAHRRNYVNNSRFVMTHANATTADTSPAAVAWAITRKQRTQHTRIPVEVPNNNITILGLLHLNNNNIIILAYF